MAAALLPCKTKQDMWQIRRTLMGSLVVWGLGGSAQHPVYRSVCFNRVGLSPPLLEVQRCIVMPVCSSLCVGIVWI